MTKNLKEFDILVAYNRRCNTEKDYFTVIGVSAEDRQQAINMVQDYEIDGMFDNIPEDYILDTLHPIRCLNPLGDEEIWQNNIFSKGDWKIEKHGDAHALFAYQAPNSHGANLMYIKKYDRNFEANKRLIEQAPKLYEELKNSTKDLEEVIQYMKAEGLNVASAEIQVKNNKRILKKIEEE